MAAELLALCDAVEAGGGRRRLPDLPKRTMKAASQLILQAVRAFRHFAKMHSGPVTERVVVALEAHVRAHPRPRSAEALVAALTSMDALLRDQFDAVGPRPGLSTQTRPRAASLRLELAHAIALRARQKKLHAEVPGIAMIARANIESLLRRARAAALITFKLVRPDLYRMVTSRYQREARRANRVREKKEPPPRTASVAGSVVDRRPRAAR